MWKIADLQTYNMYRFDALQTLRSVIFNAWLIIRQSIAVTRVVRVGSMTVAVKNEQSQDEKTRVPI